MQAAALLDVIVVYNKWGGFVDYFLPTTGERFYYTNGKPSAKGFIDRTWDVEANHPMGGYDALFFPNWVWEQAGR